MLNAWPFVAISKIVKLVKNAKFKAAAKGQEKSSTDTLLSQKKGVNNTIHFLRIKIYFSGTWPNGLKQIDFILQGRMMVILEALEGGGMQENA